MGKRLLITGGAGFVGSNLALLFREAYPDWHIISLDNLKRRGSELNLERLRRHGIHFCHGDVRNRTDLDAVGRVDTIIECSAEPSALAGLDGDAAYVVDTNLVGTVNCLELARRHQAELVFLSTSRVYPYEALNALPCRETATRFEWNLDRGCTGVSLQGVAEDFPLVGARTLYGATKLCAELLINEYVASYHLRAVVNRCGVLAGPWQMGKVDQGVAVLWVARHHFGGPCPISDSVGPGSRCGMFCMSRISSSCCTSNCTMWTRIADRCTTSAADQRGVSRYVSSLSFAGARPGRRFPSGRKRRPGRGMCGSISQIRRKCARLWPGSHAGPWTASSRVSPGGFGITSRRSDPSSGAASSRMLNKSAGVVLARRCRLTFSAAFISVTQNVFQQTASRSC
jgi:nucleoside-diphosphate-sugar epimerase